MKASCSNAVIIYEPTWQIGKVIGLGVRKPGSVIYCISHLLLSISETPGASGCFFIKRKQMRLVAFWGIYLLVELFLSN